MFVRLFAVASLAALAVAGPTPLAVRDGQCNTGSVSCCNFVKNATEVSSAFSTIGLASILDGVSGLLVGLQCSPMVGSVGCQQQPVCCDNNDFNGLIVVGCSPVNLNL